MEKVKGKRRGVERWSELLTGGTAVVETGPALYGQPTNMDSTLVTICQYYSQGTRFETGARATLHGVRGADERIGRDRSKRGARLAIPGSGKVCGWLGAEKVKPRTLK